MMRGPVVCFVVLGVFLLSIGLNDAYYIKSRVKHEGSSHDDDAPRMGESTIGNGENPEDGHYIQKRSLQDMKLVKKLNRNVARLASVLSAPSRRQSMRNSRRRLTKPALSSVPEGDSAQNNSSPDLVNTGHSPKPRALCPGPIIHPDVPVSTKPQTIPGVIEPEIVSHPIPPSQVLRFFPIADVAADIFDMVSEIFSATEGIVEILSDSFSRSSLGFRNKFFKPRSNELRNEESDMLTTPYPPENPTLRRLKGFKKVMQSFLHILNLSQTNSPSDYDNSEEQRFSDINIEDTGFVGNELDDVDDLIEYGSTPHNEILPLIEFDEGVEDSSAGGPLTRVDDYNYDSEDRFSTNLEDSIPDIYPTIENISGVAAESKECI